MMEWETVIGLEIHVQLNTESKIFSGASTAFGAQPNRQACAVDLGLPGVLPVLNEQAVNKAILFGLAINASIAEKTVFARKNYFYPDLPKGYQISQLDAPIVGRGYLDIEIEGTSKRINITRAHLEEDAGKSLHEDFHGFSGIDLNRAGTPLLEIVSDPMLSNAQEAVAYLRKIHGLVRYLGISDGNMQEGSFRCDANVSVRPKGQKELGTRTEIKNVNSFRFVERAIEYEVERHIDILESGQTIVQETRLYDADKNETRSMRSKEEANDYRYFPDPDLLPIYIDAEKISKLKSQLPELPTAKKARYIAEYQLSADEAQQLTQAPEVAAFYETVLQQTQASAKTTANWVLTEVMARLNRDDISIDACPVTERSFAQLLDRIQDETISGKIAKVVFDAMWKGEGDADAVIAAKGLVQLSDPTQIARIIEEVMAAHPDKLAEYRQGKDKLFGFFVGLVMKATQGKANPQFVNELLKSKLG